MAVTHHFDFAVDPLFRIVGAPLGIRPDACSVDVDDRELVARFGRWSVATPLSNLASATVTGPYSLPKVIGPPHLSFADHGLTFATNARAGVCLRFHAPVTGLVPFGPAMHPGLTVTVDDPDRLADLVDTIARRTPNGAHGGDPDPR